MKTVVSISMEPDQVRKIDTDPLVKDVGRSGVVRIALTEYFEKWEKSGKEEKNDKTKE